jgi:hypothetical protein
MNDYFVPLMYSSFGQMTVLFPLSLYAVYKSKNKKIGNFSESVLFYGVFTGWASIFTSAALAVKYNSLGLQQIAMIFGMLIILASIYISVNIGAIREIFSFKTKHKIKADML